MIEKIKVLELVNDALQGTDKFLVNLKITTDNRIYIDIDGDNGVTIDDCIAISRTVENQLDRDVEDYALDVSSAGADSPLKLTRQFLKNIGREIEAFTFDGQRFQGKLTAASDDCFTLFAPGTKKQPPQEVTLNRRDVKSARVLILFSEEPRPAKHNRRQPKPEEKQ